MDACKMYAYGVYTYEVYTRNSDLSLTAPMSCYTGQHTTVLSDMRWCVIMPPVSRCNGEARGGNSPGPITLELQEIIDTSEGANSRSSSGLFMPSQGRTQDV